MKIFIDSTLEICDKSLKKTSQGYLSIEGIISRSGVQEYFDTELGVGVEGNVIAVDRPKSEVVDTMSVASFINMPITDEHPDGELVNPENFTSYSKGMVLDAEPTKSGHIKATMLIQDSSLIKKIEDGKRELSAGYTAEIEFSDDGKSAIQRKIRGNHVAFVDSARCGKECRIFDSKPTGAITMAKIKIKDVEYEMADSIAPVVKSVMKDNEKLQSKVSKLEDEAHKNQAKSDQVVEDMEEMKKKVEDMEEDEEGMEKKISDAAHELLSVITDAKKVMKDFDGKGKTAKQIRHDVVIDSKPELKDKPQPYIDARFDAMVEAADKAQSSTLTDALGQAITADVIDANDARARKIARQNGGTK